MFLLLGSASSFSRSIIDNWSLWVLAIKFTNFWPCLLGMKSQKVPVHKMVRTDSQDPAGRLHAYLQVNPSSLQEKSASLTSVR